MTKEGKKTTTHILLSAVITEGRNYLLGNQANENSGLAHTAHKIIGVILKWFFGTSLSLSP